MEQSRILQSLNGPREQRTGWLTDERIKWLGAVIFVGVAGFMTGNGHTTQGAVQNIAQQLGDAKAAKACEHRVAKVNTHIATQAIISLNNAYVPTPALHEVAKDNCNPPSKK